ncbi:MAG: GNAT family N-acetyltransferase [Chloroflexota bacterium]
MSATVNFVIRDGMRSDIPDCVALDHNYETDTVWQMKISDEDGWRIDFRAERLPRVVDVTFDANEERLRAALLPEHCFLVATTREHEPETIAYLTMRSDRLHRIGWVQDVIVSRPYRRHQVGTRLTRVAARWAKEHDFITLMIETQTKNYPGIRFCEAAGFTFCGFNDHYLPNRDITVFFSQPVR